MQFLNARQNKKIKRFLQARIVLIAICMLTLTIQLPAFPHRPLLQGANIKTLVIDPGHGGKDPGAVGPGGHHEAKLALAISLKFGELIEKNFPNIKVIYTRKTDEFVSLKDRADLANKVKADLFFCIHLNSSTNKEAYGTSTYALGLHRSNENLEVAKRENAVIELEQGGVSNYDFNPNSPEGHIIMSMKQNAFLDQSLKMAASIEEQQVSLAQRKSRGVKQAGFWVLYRTAMPSILTEIGFISNLSEEQFMASEIGQRKIAASLFKGFLNYKNDLEGKNDTVDLTSYLKGAEEKPHISAPKESKLAETITAPSIDPNAKIAVKEDVAQVVVIEKKDTITIYKPETSDTPKVVQKNEQVVTEKSAIAETPKTVEKNVTVETPVEKGVPKVVPKNEQVVNDTSPVTYHIQIVAGVAPPKNSSAIQEKFGEIYTDKLPNSNITRYLIGNFKTAKEARKELANIRAWGLTEAFLVVYENGVRVPSGKHLADLLK